VALEFWPPSEYFLIKEILMKGGNGHEPARSL